MSSLLAINRSLLVSAGSALVMRGTAFIHAVIALIVSDLMRSVDAALVFLRASLLFHHLQLNLSLDLLSRFFNELS
jgi:hypothetical protein